MTRIQFFCPGTPKPGGSKRAFYNKKTGRAMLTDDSGKGGKDWRGDLRSVASNAYHWQPLEEALSLKVRFIMPRPQSHYRANGALKPNAPLYCEKAPDTTKLLRSLEDALTKITWADDKHIVIQMAEKMYGDKPGAHVLIETIDDSVKTEPPELFGKSVAAIAGAPNGPQ